MVPMTGNKLSASPEAMARARRSTRRWASRPRTSPSGSSVAREEQDAFALASQQKAAAARAGGQVRRRDRDRAGHALRRRRAHRRSSSAADELIRPDTTLEGLAALKPAFSTKGQRHRGQQLAALGRRRRGARDEQRQGDRARPLAARRTSARFATVGVDPAIMGIGPIPAVKKLLAQDGALGQATSISSRSTRPSRARRSTCSARSSIPDEKLNVNGGAIALGHPLGLHRRQAHGDRAPRAARGAAAATPWSPCASAAAWAPPASSSACRALPGRVFHGQAERSPEVPHRDREGAEAEEGSALAMAYLHARIPRKLVSTLRPWSQLAASAPSRSRCGTSGERSCLPPRRTPRRRPEA